MLHLFLILPRIFLQKDHISSEASFTNVVVKNNGFAYRCLKPYKLSVNFSYAECNTLISLLETGCQKCPECAVE